MRIAKLMAARGMCSRREAEALISKGWVSVAGAIVSELGMRVPEDVEITLDPKADETLAQSVTILLNKPVGIVSGQPEDGYKAAVEIISRENQHRTVTDEQVLLPRHLRGLAPAGRLDIDSQGLLVLTQDGRVARALIGGDSKIEKEYLVRYDGNLDDRALALLNHGLSLDGRLLRPAQVTLLSPGVLKFILREGRKRQIRRMCALVGLEVTHLKRVRIGKVLLGRLPYGQWRFLGENESF